MPNDEREPIVIELEDGKARWVAVVHDGKITPFSLQAFPGHADGPRINLYAGNFGELWLPLAEDPFAAAVQAETERCKAAVTRTCGLMDFGRPTAKAFHDAIDAPPEEVSEYERGGEAMRKRCDQLVYALRHELCLASVPATIDDLSGLRERMHVLSLTEPTP